ncbi:hypothetical protein [Lacticaseibacillus absianus]|uniref:hypothetical protein n=1 Tax=Lacticaseibacillus absianus TaxID=2729623 RepID=UPI0015CB896F|nr:hypothetical protein [Lacticaseibacillus absianus]
MSKYTFGTRTLLGALLVAAASGAVTATTAVGTVVDQTSAQYKKGYVTYVKGKAAAAKQLSSAKQQLDDGADQLTGYHQQLAEAKIQLATGKQQLDANRGPLADASVQLDAGKQALDAAAGQLADAKQQLDDAAPQLEAGRQQLADGAKTLATKQAELNAGKAQLAANAAAVATGRQTIAQGKQAQAALAKLSDQLPQLVAAMKDPRQTVGPQLGDAAPLFDGLTTWAQFATRATALATAKQDAVAADIAPLYAGLTQQAVAANMPALPDGTPTEVIDATTAQVTAAVQPTVIQSFNQAGTAVSQGLDAVTQAILPVAAQLQGFLPQVKTFAPQADLSALTTVVALPEATLSQRLAKADALAKVLGSAEFTATFSELKQSLATQIKDGEAQIAAYEAGQRQVAAGEQALAAGAKTLQAGRQEFATQSAQYYNGRAQYADGLQQYLTGQAEYDRNETAYQAGLAQFQQGEKSYQAGVQTYTTQKAQVDAGQAEWDKNHALYVSGKADATKQLRAGQKQLAQAESVLTTLGTTITKPKAGRAVAPVLTTSAPAWPWFGFALLGLISVTAALFSVLGGVKDKPRGEVAAALRRLTWLTGGLLTGASALTTGALMLIVPSVIKNLSGGALTVTLNPLVLAGVVLTTAVFTILGGFIAQARHAAAAKTQDPTLAPAAE